MIRILAFVLLLASLAGAALTENNWDGSASSDWNTADNWSQSRVPLSSDSVTFTAGAVACSLSAASVCSTLQIAAGYTGTFKQPAGYKLTVGGPVSLAGQGTLSLNDSVLVAQDGQFYISNVWGTVTISACNLKLMGTGNFQIVEASSLVKTLNCGYSGKTTTWTGSAATSGVINVITLNSGTLTVNGQMRLHPTTTSTPLDGTGTINGNSTLSCLYNGTGSGTLTGPPSTITWGGTASLWLGKINTGTPVTFNLAAAVSVGGSFYCYPTVGGGTGAFTFNTQNYAVSATSDITFGNHNIGNTSTFNFGSSIITAGTVNALALTQSGTENVNLQTSQWTVGGNVTIRAGYVLDPGTSLLTVNGTSTITSNGKSLYDVVLNNAASTFTLGDSIVCNTLTLTAGTFTSAAKKVRTTDDQLYDGAGNLTLSGGNVVTGDGDFHIGSTIGTFTGGSTLTLQGTGSLDIDEVILSSPFTTITTGNTGKITTVTGAASILANTQFVFGAGTTTINSNYHLRVTTQTQPLSINGSATINGSGWLGLGLTPTTAVTCTIPQLIMTGTTGLRIIDTLSTSKFTVNQSGLIRIGGNLQIRNHRGTATDTMFYNTGDFSIKCDTMQNGGAVASSVTQIHYGGSACTLNAFDGNTYNSGVKKIFADSSTWAISGNYTAGTSATFNAGTSQMRWLNSGTLTGNGRTFYDVTISGGTLTLADSLKCRNVTTSGSGALTATSRVIVPTGNVKLQGTGAQALPTWLMLSADPCTLDLSTSGTVTSAACSVDLSGGTAILYGGTGKKRTFGRMVFYGKTYTWSAGDSTAITGGNPANDWSGTVENVTIFRSTVTGSRAYFSAPAGASATYMDVRDNYNYGSEIDVTSVTNIDSGNNFGWRFAATVLRALSGGWRGGWQGYFKGKRYEY